MELIDVIKSSILLFVVITTTIIFVSFAIYKLRNQAKIPKSKFAGKIEGNSVEFKRLKNEQDEPPAKTETSKKKKLKSSQKTERFQIVNSFQSNSRRKNRNGYKNELDVYKFYTEAPSSDLFKIKVDEDLSTEKSR